MNNTAEESALARETGHFVRDAVNVDLTPAGKVHLRPGVQKVTSVRLKNLWQSSLHKDTFATLDEEWVKVNPLDWSTDPLATLGEGEVFHEILNNHVCVAGPSGIFTYDGQQARKLTIDTPAPPFVTTGEGSLVQGLYGVAVAWLRGSVESATSALAQVDVPANGSLEITFPLCLSTAITGIRLYMTHPNGGELLRAGDYLINEFMASVPLLPQLGAAAQFRHLSPMPTGKYLKYWRGRLLVANGSVLRFSEAMAYHLHNERYGFVQFPQRITFVQPVDGGIWVGQVDHVVFVEGNDPANMSVQRKTSKAPIPGSAIQVQADIGGELASGGVAAVIWLAENGYVAGNSTGQVVELHAGVMRGITAESGTSVVLDRRLLTAVT